MDINDLRAGNHKAFEILFNEWYEPLCRYAYSILQNSDDAEDMVQKVFFKLWDQRNNLDIHTSMKSYLYRIVHNDCLNKIRQSRIRAEHHQYLSYIGTNTISDTANPLLRSDLEKNIANAIDRLPPRCREVFEMSRFHFLSYSEIARNLGITPNTVETQIVKALRLLRKELKDYLIFMIWIIFITTL